MFCEYSDIFGKPGEGVHAQRIFGLAAVDVVGTIAIAAAFAWVFKKSFILTLIVLIFIAEVMHFVFCSETAVIKHLKMTASQMFWYRPQSLFQKQ